MIGMKAKNFSSKFLTSKMQIVSNKVNPEGIVVMLMKIRKFYCYIR